MAIKGGRRSWGTPLYVLRLVKELPLVVVSSKRGDSEPLVDAGALARSLVGIAHVVVLDSTSAFGRSVA